MNDQLSVDSAGSADGGAWRTAVTAHTVTRAGARWLMVRHERDGVTSWEVPGGHVEHGESLEAAAARETAEEAGVAVRVGRLLASCVHEWSERRERRLVCFFEASAASSTEPRTSEDEPDILEAAWVDPHGLASVSPFLLPLIEQDSLGWPDPPLHFRMTHRRNAAGFWEPAATDADA